MHIVFELGMNWFELGLNLVFELDVTHSILYYVLIYLCFNIYLEVNDQHTVILTIEGDYT